MQDGLQDKSIQLIFNILILLSELQSYQNKIELGLANNRCFLQHMVTWYRVRLHYFLSAQFLNP